MTQRQAAKHFNISRDSVAKMVAYSTPPGYQRRSPIRRPKLDAFVSTIDHWLDEDRHVPRKQRHTAKRVFDRLRDECGFTGGYTIIKDYMRERDQRRQEVFVPLSHRPGHAQADFGEATVVIGGVEQKARFFVLDLPHSDGCYVRAYPAAVAEAWVDGHIHAFAFFGAVPQSIVYDNDRCLVAKILPDGTRKRAALFSGFLSHYLIRDRYGRPGKGNDKGNVEGLVGYARRNFMVPIPQFPTWDAFNAFLEEQCRKRQRDRLRGETGWREVEIGRGSSDATCRVAALENWIKFAKIAKGPLFRRVTGQGKNVGPDRLNDQEVARLVKKTALAAGVRGDLSEAERGKKFAGHSLRAGLASSAEVDERHVQKQLGHASAEMTRRYQRRRDRFRVNLTKAAGL